MFASAIYQTQASPGIESKHSDIDFGMIVRSSAVASNAPRRCTRRVSPANYFQERLSERIVLTTPRARIE